MSAAAAPTNGFGPSTTVELDSARGAPATVLVRGARLLDPRSGLNGVSDVLVREGRIAEISATLDAPDGAEVVEAEGLHAFPAFVDPHVHLRTPGREDEEDVESGTRAPAAAARVPESTSSSSSRPGVRRCTCGSTNAGSATRPSPSTTSAPGPGSSPPGCPSSATCPSRTRTSAGRSRPARGSSARAPWIRTSPAPAGAAWSS